MENSNEEHVLNSAERIDRRRFMVRGLGVGGAVLAFPSLLQSGRSMAASTTSTAVTTRRVPAAAGKLAELIWSFNTPPSTLDPMLAGDLASESAISNSVEALVVYDAEGAIQPYLAESWTQPDPTTYVFTMREGVKFWDGTAMTMDDVMYWMDRITKNERSIFVSYFADIASFEQTGEMELTIRLSAPSPTFLGLAVFLFVGQKKFTEEHEDDLGTPGALGVFTGQYEMTEWKPEESLTLVRNDSYWGAAPTAEKVTYLAIPDDETRRLALEAGDIHGGFNIPPAQIEQWASSDGVVVDTRPNLQFGYISFDTSQAPWSDAHVRKAVAHAIDREGIVNSILRGNAEVATSYPPREAWVSLLPADGVDALYARLPQYEFDLDKARDELSQSAFADGFSGTLPVPSTPPELSKIALTISENLRGIGIELEVTEVTAEAWRELWYTNKDDTQIQLILNGPTVQDPADFPGQMLTKRYNAAGGYNTANYINDRIEELWQEQTEALDPQVRIDAISEVLSIAAEDMPYAPIYWGRGAVALRDTLEFEGFHAAWYVIQPWAATIRPK